MKKLSEVCKYVGVTRRTLQEYNKIGLLHPSAKTESGYWLYDDNAIMTLAFIQIMVETGYTRKEIKSLLQASELDLNREYDHVLETLEAKKKRIEGLISIIKTVKGISVAPESASLIAKHMDFSPPSSGKSIMQSFNDSIKTMSDYNEEDREHIELATPFWTWLNLLVRMKGNPFDDIAVNEYCRSALNSLMPVGDYLQENEGGEKTTIVEIASGVIENISDIAQDPDFATLVNDRDGGETVTYVVNAIKHYCSRILSEETK